MAINPVAIPSPRYTALLKERDLSTTLMGGSAAMREAGTKYCPKHTAETDQTYKHRLEATSLYNAYKDAVLKQTGKLFTEGVQLGEDVPPEIATLCENIDGQGRALTPFCMDAMLHAMADGISYILVDFPSIPTGATMADQKRIGAQPYWCLVKADDFIGWRTEDRAGTQTITQVRIREDVYEPKGEYEEELKRRIRVLTPGNYELYELTSQKGAVEEWTRIKEGATSIQEVTLVPVYTNRIALLEGLPPLQSLAELNRDHWVSSTEQRHALSFLRFAMLLLTGVDSEKIGGVQVGPDKIIGLPVGSDAKYIEHNGKGIDAGFKDLEQLEARMESAGMTVRIENAGNVTATTSAINSEEHGAALKAIAQGLKDSIEQALQFTAQMLKLPDGGTVEVYDEFGEAPPEGTPADLSKLRATRDISRDTLWAELKRRRVLADDFDAEKEKGLLEQDAPNDLTAMAGGPQFGQPFNGPKP